MFGDAHLGNERKYKEICFIKVRIVWSVIEMGHMGWSGCFLGDKDSLHGQVYVLSMVVVAGYSPYDLLSHTQMSNGFLYLCFLFSKNIFVY